MGPQIVLTEIAGSGLHLTLLAALTRGIATLACTGNSSSALNGRTIDDKLRENQLTGTAVLAGNRPTG